jgi:S1-C subfamily serine protease
VGSIPRFLNGIQEARVTGLRVHLLVVSLLACAAAQAPGQFQTVLVNRQGATAPCTGIGPVGAPLAKKCVEVFQQAGFIKQDELGYSGLTIGTTGKDDGVIVAIAPQSPAASAGLEVGDVITAVAAKPVKPTPGAIAAKAVFGKRGETLHLTLKRGSSEVEVSLVRDARSAPEGPKSPGMLIMVRSMFNWQSQVVPCMGAGPAAMAAIEYCYGHFKSFGFLKAGELGSTGFQIDPANESKAVVSALEPESPAAKAGMQVGDEIVAVEGKPLTASRGETATELLFGKTGAPFDVTVQRDQADPTFKLVMATKPKK